MIKEKNTFLSNDCKTKIHYIKWMPDSKEYKGIIQLVHGMIEYIGRYEDFAGFLVENGYMVVGHDHLGHGESVLDEDCFGYFSKKNPSDILVQDIHKLRKITQKDNEGVPYFIFGHSMGSYLLRKYLAFYSKGLSGAIICGTGYSPRIRNEVAVSFVKILKKFKGDKYISNLVENLMHDKPYRKFDLSGKDTSNSWITRDENIVRLSNSDKYCSFKFTLNGYQGLFEAVLFSCKQKNVDRIDKDLPVLIISGDDDPVGNLGKGVKKVYSMFKKSGKTDLKVKLYQGYRHEIINEIGREVVYNDVLKWIEKRA